MKPVIVVSAFNRPKSLIRILSSLDMANYGSYESNVKLIISIDFSGNDEVKKVAENFIWRHGEKELIVHQSNLGLKEHILSCGDLTSKYGSIILLEDDLFVSPHFYTYASDALDFYSNDSRVAGISLYKHMFNETARLPFTPLTDDSDVFFMQLASSWGQVWTSDQWNRFKKWYNTNPSINSDDKLPWDVKLWSESSWKKYFIKYLIVKDKYFVYPQVSLSTNFGDSGTHHKNGVNSLLQVPITFLKEEFSFIELEKSNSIYDSFCEPLPHIIKKHFPKLKEFNFEIDFYRTKDFSILEKDLVLTTVSLNEYKKISSNILLSFALQLKPIELNILMNLKGKNIVLVPKNPQINAKSRAHRLLLIEYFYKSLDRDLLKAMAYKVWSRFKF